MLAFEVIDQYGLPVPNVPVTFGVSARRWQIVNPDPATNHYGIATAEAIMGPAPGANMFTATAAGMTAQFLDNGVLQPVISDNGVVNAASYLAGPGIAPGSYVSIFGANLSLGLGGETTAQSPGLHQRRQRQLRCPGGQHQRAGTPDLCQRRNR